MDKSRVKICIQTGEIEFEGSEEFVKEQINNNLHQIIDLVFEMQVSGDENDEIEDLLEEKTEKEEEKISSIGNSGLEITDSFGEWLNKFKDNLTEMDKALLTAYYIQKTNESNEFKTSQVTKALKEHGINLSNPSTFLRMLTKKKLMFQTRKEGSLKYLRVSADGVNELKSLLR